jgi:nucleoid DNA-binding protein
MIVKYITNLLAEHEKVVVPHLGTFTTSYAHAEPTEQDSVLPPKNNISFYEYEVNNGDLLRNAILQQEKIEEVGYQKILKDFTDDIKTQVAIFGSYEINGLGKFFKNENGVLRFEQQGSQNFLGHSFGLPKVDYQPLKTNTADHTNTTTTKQTADPMSMEEEKEKRKSSELVWWLVVIPLLCVFAFLIYLFTDKDAIDRFKAFFNGGKDTPVALNVSESKSYDNFQKTKSEVLTTTPDNTETNNATASEVPEPEKEDKEAMINKNKVAKADLNTATSTNTPEVAATGKFYIVLASFTVTNKADKMRETMQAKGVEAKVITGKDGKVFRVVYNQEFSTDKEASPKVAEINQKLNAQVWVAKY